MKLYIVMHESFEAPATIEIWARQNNHEISYVRLYQGDEIPKNDHDFDFLVIMGGPQSPATTKTECPYFDVAKEISFAKSAIENGKLVFGVCLGAQIIGEALGAKFDHSPNKEIGFFEIKLTEAGKKDPIFSSFPEKIIVGHWHGDMPGVTNTSEIIAYSDGCPRQIVKYSDKVYGFQCHFEFTPKSLEGMIQNNAQELKSGKNLPYVQDADELRKHACKEMNTLLFKFLNQFSKNL